MLFMRCYSSLHTHVQVHLGSSLMCYFSFSKHMHIEVGSFLHKLIAERNLAAKGW